jgi:hypothetical protein
VSSVAKKPCQDYRITYDVDDTTRTVTVAVVGYRREVYKGPGSVGPATPALVAGELGIPAFPGQRLRRSRCRSR